MAAPKVKTTKPVVPMIYAYTTPEIKRHDGWTKIGYTEIDVATRIWQQTHTADVEAVEQWRGTAIYDDGTGDRFRDEQFHAYLRKSGVEQEKGKDNEWFRISGPDSHEKFFAFKANRGLVKSDEIIPYNLRNEQSLAVQNTKEYYDTKQGDAFLWNAKPRFGKTLSVYDFIKRIDAQNVLIVTNRPAIANSWYSDYEQFLGTDSGFLFVSETDSLKGKPHCISRSEYITITRNTDYNLIEFLSLQDLKGSIYFGGKFDKLKEVQDINWDVLVIDEAHEGVDTRKTDVAFDHIKRKFTLHLSGTPFKALANDKFPDGAIFNWTYADEQEAKRNWQDEQGDNPYETLPQLHMFTYQMSEIIKDEIDQGIEIQGETEEYAFDLNEFFATNGQGRFNHDSSVDRFLDALCTQERFPFSTEELRNELKHTFWLLNRVDSAKALAKKLENHPVFSEYKVVLAAGDGKIDDADDIQKSFDKVKAAIREYDKTITLSVGQLTTGVTIPEWTAVMMLSNMQSAPLYMQAAFRAQNPCLFEEDGNFLRKENAYVFDFDPARTLIIYEQFANDLYTTTRGGRGDTEERKENIKRLLNFFPVLGEDEQGEMVELDAEKVLTIPRKIKSQEVVRRGFMSNYLFQNISNIFSAPKEVMDILNSFPATPQGADVTVAEDTKTDLHIDESGEVNLDDEYVIGVSSEVFGDKIYEVITPDIIIEKGLNQASSADAFKKQITDKTVEVMVSTVKEAYSEDIKKSDVNQIERQIASGADKALSKVMDDYQITKLVIEKERSEALENAAADNRTVEEVNAEYNQKQLDATEKLKIDLTDTYNQFVEDVKKEVIKTVETNIDNRKKNDIEDTIRDHLRGFSRTIPSFLMAYGDDTVTLATFDSVIPDNVFVEVTSITLDQFKFLRDGGKYIDSETGEEKEFKGNLFDPVVFDDSVREFLRLKKKLADYFDEQSIEDIFDYIPPQKTNQIFTPKKMVQKMVDMLEEENPGCFDMPDKTFIDLYMKSGMYITEIVKRLFQSEEMKKLFPDEKQRLKHIFEKQVYGLAPTEIIYKIATSYILGFAEDFDIEKHNFRQADALPYAKEGKLQELLDELFADNN